MFKKLSAFVLLLLHTYHVRRDYQLAFMAYQNQMLRRRLGNKRFIPRPSASRNNSRAPLPYPKRCAIILGNAVPRLSFIGATPK